MIIFSDECNELDNPRLRVCDGRVCDRRPVGAGQQSRAAGYLENSCPSHRHQLLHRQFGGCRRPSGHRHPADRAPAVPGTTQGILWLRAAQHCGGAHHQYFGSKPAGRCPGAVPGHQRPIPLPALDDGEESHGGGSDHLGRGHSPRSRPNHGVEPGTGKV